MAKHWICCYYCIPWIPSFRLICIKPYLKHFHFRRSFRSFVVIRGHQKVKHWICCCFCIPGVRQLSFDIHKAVVKKFSFVEVIQVIRGHQKVKHWIFCCYCIPRVPSFRLICIKPQLKHFHFWRSFRSLEVVSQNSCTDGDIQFL